jgi:hypothetical protein
MKGFAGFSVGRFVCGFRTGGGEADDDAPAAPALPARHYSDLFARADRNVKRLILAFHAGRSGMKWMCRIFAAHDNAYGFGERNRLAESFYRYVAWNRLPIDTSGNVEIMKREAVRDWQRVDISVLDSPYFAHDIPRLYAELNPDWLIWGINDPVFTVTSFLNKGWYSEDYTRQDRDLVNGFFPAMEGEWSHLFGRIVPVGEFYDTWLRLTQVGKIAWFVNEINAGIEKGLRSLPPEKLWVFRLEAADQNYQFYLGMAEKFGLRPLLPEAKFLALKQRATKPGENVKRQWTARETDEFRKYAADYIRMYEELKRHDA